MRVDRALHVVKRDRQLPGWVRELLRPIGDSKKLSELDQRLSWKQCRMEEERSGPDEWVVFTDLGLALRQRKLLAHVKLYTRTDGTSSPRPGLE